MKIDRFTLRSNAHAQQATDSQKRDDGRGDDDQEGAAQPAGRGAGAPRGAGAAGRRGQEERGAGQGAAGRGRRVRVVHPHAQARAGQDVAQAHPHRIKQALAADPVAGVTKVMTVKKLRKSFSRFEDKRALAAAFDLFLADDRVLPYLKGPLGTKFFAKKKQPVAVRVSRKNVAASLRLAARRTALHVSAGVCNNVKVARLDMAPELVVDNVMVAMNSAASLVPKGWNGVQSISLKTSDSVALPVYNALATLAKLPPVGKTANLKKRKLEEVVAEAAAADAPKPTKQAKKAAPKKQEKQVQAKQDDPPKPKKAAPKKAAAKKPAKTEAAAEKAAETTTPPAKKKARGKKKVAKK
ncbi:unnamed protein product [Phytophthora fragariaefolia]|uniref:Unnamed protein product n=1 Tax=Phytophthora fragariaefolia TaxID=1490495 RepID=A0A9W6TVJ6_9STRA|nr:unnamed protein product [Phytophthora fragariaefolia]